MASSGIKGRYARRLHPFLLALRAVRAAALDAAPDTTGGQRTARHRGNPEAETIGAFGRALGT